MHFMSTSSAKIHRSHTNHESKSIETDIPLGGDHSLTCLSFTTMAIYVFQLARQANWKSVAGLVQLILSQHRKQIILSKIFKWYNSGEDTNRQTKNMDPIFIGALLKSVGLCFLSVYLSLLCEKYTGEIHCPLTGKW